MKSDERQDRNQDHLKHNDGSVLIKKNYVENIKELPVGKENTTLYFPVGTPRLQCRLLGISSVASREKKFSINP